MSAFTKRSLEGYLLIDHRGAEAACLQGPGTAVPVRPGAMYEASTITCSHCQRIVIVNPLRTRERAYCPKCDHYVCDACEAIRQASGGACKTFKQVMDEVCELAHNGKLLPHTILKPGD